MARVDGESERASELCAVTQRRESLRVVRGMGVRTGVQLDRVGAQFGGGVNGIRIGIDEQTAANARRAQSRDGLGQHRDVLADGESSLRRHFFAALGDEGDLDGAQSLGQRQHFRRGCALEVQGGDQRFGEPDQVGVLDVAPVFTQMGGDAIRARLFAQLGRGDRVGGEAAPRLPDGGDVIDVDEQTEQGRTLRRFAGGVTVDNVRVGGFGHVVHAGNAAKEEAVRKQRMLAGVLIVTMGAAACTRAATPAAPTPAPAPLTGATSGAADARAAVESFMKAVKAQDLQTMAAVWGTSRGPARDQLDREQLEKRLIIIQCKLDHEQWGFAEDRARLLAGGKQDFQVRLRQKGASAVTSFTTIQATDGRWYVEIVDLDPLRDFCR